MDSLDRRDDREADLEGSRDEAGVSESDAVSGESVWSWAGEKDWEWLCC